MGPEAVILGLFLVSIINILDEKKPLLFTSLVVLQVYPSVTPKNPVP